MTGALTEFAQRFWSDLKHGLVAATRPVADLCVEVAERLNFR